MARDYARVKLSIWDDDDFRNLTQPAQGFYLALLTSPTLSYCGVGDWRPKRLAALSLGSTETDIRALGEELADTLFLVVDESTEEFLIRSFVRHDGLMGQPNVAAAMAKDFAGIASSLLRGVVVHELNRLHDTDPGLKGWGRAKHLLDKASLNPSENPSVWGSVWGSGNPSDNPNPNPSGSPCLTPSPAPTPSPHNPTAPRKRGARIADDFAITDEMRQWAHENTPGVNLEAATTEFVDYWRGVTGTKGTKLDWVATWRNRMREVAGRVDEGKSRHLAAVPDRPSTVEKNPWRYR